MSWRPRCCRPPCARGACVRCTRAQSRRTGLFAATLCSTVLREGGLGLHGHASGGIGGPKLYPIALRRPASREERSVEQRLLRAKGKARQRLPPAALGEVGEAGGDQLPMHDQARIALDLGHIAPVVVDPVGIEEQRGIAKQHGFVRQEALPMLGLRRGRGSRRRGRSEEHTSELQSLMRISYAVL